MREKEQQIVTVMVKKPECLGCTHLVPFVDGTAYDCYQDKLCPAREGVRICIGTDLENASNRIADAMRENDVGRLKRLMNKLSKFDKRIQDEIMSKAKKKAEE